jgi:hypothetical protein
MQHQFAITYPQLMNQAAGLGLESRDLVRLHEGHELAVRLVDGIYRKQGVPFLCHLVRTASIVMTETRSVDVILAAMLHAVHFLHYFQGSGRRGPRASDRAFLRDIIGSHAETLVSRYGDFAWNEPGVVRGYAETADQHSAETRELLLMQLANELEDHLDAVTAYLDVSEPGARDASFGAEYIELAEALGHNALALSLNEAFDLCRRTEVPSSVRRQRIGSYELRSRLWKANVVERLGSALRRFRANRADPRRRLK